MTRADPAREHAVLRQPAQPRTTFAPPDLRSRGERRGARQSAARWGRLVGRLLLAPFAALAAALAGVLFVLLLPVCGIASIAEAIARASAAFVGDALRRALRGDAPHA